MKNTKDLILANTFVLLLKKGYDSVSISDIAAKIGMSRGLIYRYFDDKSDLIFESCKKFFLEEFLTDIEEISLEQCIEQFIKNLKRVIKMLSEIAGETIDVLKYNLLYAEVLMRDARLKNSARDWTLYLKKNVLSRAKKSGEIKNLPDTFIQNVFLDILSRVSYFHKEPSAEYCIKAIINDIRIFYKLIRA
ncbi:MAG: TetR/AcrR family transcriptional regulator [Opitutales bacterium]|nr:TetR/AcrR family transcriptional regulator [Opitutales bacterium]